MPEERPNTGVDLAQVARTFEQYYRPRATAMTNESNVLYRWIANPTATTSIPSLKTSTKKVFVCNDCNETDHAGELICPKCKSKDIRVEKMQVPYYVVSGPIDIADNDEIPF